MTGSVNLAREPQGYHGKRYENHCQDDGKLEESFFNAALGAVFHAGTADSGAQATFAALLKEYAYYQ